MLKKDYPHDANFVDTSTFQVLHIKGDREVFLYLNCGAKGGLF